MTWTSPRPALHDQPPHPLRDLAARVAQLCLTILDRAARFTPRFPVFLALALLRLGRAHSRIQSILARCAAGTWRAPRPSRPQPKRARAPAPHLPRRRGWLGHVTDHNVRSLAAQFTALLADPGTAAILARAPLSARAALARTLRGPARLLALDLPPVLQFPGPPRPQKPLSPRPSRGEPEGGSRPRAPRLPPAPPLNLPRNILRAARYFHQKFGPDT